MPVRVILYPRTCGKHPILQGFPRLGMLGRAFLEGFVGRWVPKWACHAYQRGKPEGEFSLTILDFRLKNLPLGLDCACKSAICNRFCVSNGRCVDGGDSLRMT